LSEKSFSTLSFDSSLEKYLLLGKGEFRKAAKDVSSGSGAGEEPLYEGF